jgi:hypothetical protein
MESYMRVELSRYRVKPGKSARVDEWMQTLTDRRDECLETLVREQMKFEVIFREQIGENEFLYWLTVQGEEGEEVKTSPFDIDHVHIEFWNECIDRDYGEQNAFPQLILVPPHIAQAMEWANPESDGRVGYP